ncbi:LuxR C-terminal-related transcriptional regulator [Georgenia muralis]|uniref:ATP/maltotriose-dependent transcriptional regulator MalT n=1 Tax=Georgenia muralis TaxID=154117 RepID=A0A3N4Z520_9MICO|nr:LuxR C-terminal-related transcriptional regulator [Georgenia muralis]RPF27527.1 ATP/maltotriose-dependent transcriptional regulator MalT [Georgenia muralis]
MPPSRRDGDGRGLPRVPEAFFPADAAWSRLSGLPALVVVQAPRGYGKTATVSAWLRRRDLPQHDLVWASVPPSVTSRAEFWAALHDAVVLAGHENPGEGEDGWERLARTAGARRRDLVIVVDAYDRQPDESVDAELVELAHEHEQLHLVLIMRAPRPAVALAGASGDAVVLRAEDLTLDPRRAALLGRSLGVTVSPDAAAELCAGAGGWPGLLRVALLTSTPDEEGDPLPDVSGIAAYLRVVLADLDGDGAAGALTALAVPGAVTRDATAALLGPTEAPHVETVLARMARAGLLLPGAAGELRYPPLLRAGGRQILVEDDPARFRALSATSARLATTAGDAPAALGHAVDAQDTDLLRDTVETTWAEVLDGHRDLLREALTRLPDDGPRVRALRELVLPASVPRWFAEALQSGLPLVEPGGEGLPLAATSDPPGLPAAITDLASAELRGADLLRAAHAFYEAARRASPGATRREAASGLALTLALMGHPRTAVRWLAWGRRDPVGTDGPLERVAATAVPAIHDLDALHPASPPGSPPVLGEGERWLEAVLLYAWAGRSLHGPGAEEHLADLERYREQRGVRVERLTETLLLTALVDLCLATDNLTRARTLLTDVRGADPLWADVARAKVALYTGDDRGALDLSRTPGGVVPLLCRPALEGLLVHAVAAYRLGERGTATGALDLATRIAERTGLLRPFLLVPRGDLESVAATLPGGGELLDSSVLAAGSGPFPEPVRSEPLSGRELKVLRELAAGRPVAVIARRLYVSESTVKTQVRSIYRKLGVHTRTDAVARGQLLGVLPPED